MRKILQKLVVFSSAITFALLPLHSFAAQINLQAQSPQLVAGSQFEIQVRFDAQNQDINAISGEVAFSNLQLKVDQIKEGSSIISLWVEHPHVASNGRSIDFSGVIPGGYHEDGGELFSVIFEVLKGVQGQGSVILQNPVALLNDGNGTAAQTTGTSFDYQVSKTGQVSKVSVQTDKEPPESFTPQIGRDPSIFNNQWFLSFATTDKISGVAYYEVRQGWGFYHREESPVLVSDQDLDEPILVKAVDQQGNARVVYLPPTNQKSFLEKYAIYAIIAALIIALWWLFRNKIQNIKIR